MTARPGRRLALICTGLLAALSAGCVAEEDSVDDRLAKLESLVPATGVVTIDGKPVAGVIVTFLPAEWAPAHGETDEEGRFTLKTAARPGALVGDYKVTLSLLRTEDGQPIGLERRGSLTPDPDVAAATELLPPSVSSLETTTLTATVPPGGGTFPFEVDAQLPEITPQPDAPAEAEAEAETEAEAEPPAE